MVLIDGSTIEEEKGLPNPQKEIMELKQALYQTDLLYKNYVVLCMILIERAGGNMSVTENELNLMKESNQGLRIQTDEKTETATFTLTDIAEEKEENENDDSQPDSEEDISEQVPEEGDGNVE